MGRDIGEVFVQIVPLAAAAALGVFAPEVAPALAPALTGLGEASEIATTAAVPALGAAESTLAPALTGLGEASEIATTAAPEVGGLADTGAMAVGAEAPSVPVEKVPQFPEEPFPAELPPLPPTPHPELTVNFPPPPPPPPPAPPQPGILERIGTAVAGVPEKLLNAATSPGALVGAGLFGANMLGNALNPPPPPLMIGMGGQDPFSPVQPTINAGGPPATMPTRPSSATGTPQAPLTPPAPTLAQALQIEPQTGRSLAVAPAPGMLPGGGTVASQQQLPALVPPTYASPLTSGSISFTPSAGLMVPSSEDMVRRAALHSQGGMFAGV